jgi:hypothetical protein
VIARLLACREWLWLSLSSHQAVDSSSAEICIHPKGKAGRPRPRTRAGKTVTSRMACSPQFYPPTWLLGGPGNVLVREAWPFLLRSLTVNLANFTRVRLECEAGPENQSSGANPTNRPLLSLSPTPTNSFTFPNSSLGLRYAWEVVVGRRSCQRCCWHTGS